jgi:hypothetical protein
MALRMLTSLAISCVSLLTPAPVRGATPGEPV